MRRKERKQRRRGEGRGMEVKGGKGEEKREEKQGRRGRKGQKRGTEKKDFSKERLYMKIKK